MPPSSITKTAITLLALLAVAGCVTSPPKIGGDPTLRVLHTAELPKPALPELAAGERSYILGAGDKLIIDVYGIDVLTKREVRIDGSGWISLPLVGDIQVGGQPIGAVEASIEQRLRGNFVRNPQVAINVSETTGRRFTVEGEVRTPGILPLVGQITLLQAIAQAQGTTEFTKLNDVVVFRTVDGQRYAALYNLKAIRHGAYPDPEIIPNDIITVGDSRARRIFKDLLQVVPLLTAPLIVAVQG